MNLPQLTPAQRDAGAERLGRNVALLSGAGCGKTFVLATRFTQLLLRHPQAKRPDEQDQAMARFVALTFTDKAAMEMVQRVRAMLRSLAERADGADRRDLLGWLESVSEARISTIHGFCASILRAHAIEAGLDPDFAVCAEPVVADRMLADAVEGAILAAMTADDPAVATMLGATSFDRMGEIVHGLVARRTHADLHGYDDLENTLQNWETQLALDRQAAQGRLASDSAVRDSLSALEAFSCGDPDDKLLPSVTETIRLAREILATRLEESAERFSALADLRTGNTGRKEAWSDPPIEVRRAGKALQAALGEYALYAESLGETDRQAAAALAVLTRLAGQAGQRYRRAKRRKGLLDFDDLIGLTRDLLAGNAALRRAIADGIDQLLLDEAQDTDATQLRLLLTLLGANNALPEEGKLFVVGDAKQSIYRFRGARVEVFEELCGDLGASRQVELDASFRTHASGVAFVNHVFGAVLGEGYAPLRSRRDVKSDHPTVELLLAQGPTQRDGSPRPLDTAEAATAAQAALTAQRIAEMIDAGERLVWDESAEAYRPVRAGDIAILFSRMTNSLQYERELQRRSVPYYVVAGTGFFRQQEVSDALNALRAVENPFDDLAVVGALRSAMFGLDDNTLLHIAQTHRPPYLPALEAERLRDRVSDDTLEAVRFACDLLRRLTRQKDALALGELLQCLLDETGYEATLLAQFQGRRRLGNVRLLLDQARAAEGHMSLGEFLSEMDERILSEGRFEQAAVAGEEENVVRLMTIHKAKGLEFPVVFVPDLNQSQAPGRDATLHRGDWGLTTRFVPAVEDDQNDAPRPLSYRLARRREEEDEDRETIRKYYVALTRHEDHLVLLGADLRDGQGRFKGAKSFLARLDKALGVSDHLETGSTELPYGDRPYKAVLRRISPSWPKGEKYDPPRGEAILAAAGSARDVSDAIFAVARKGPTPAGLELLGALPERIGRAELAVTALSEFEHCEALFHWRYELQGPPAPTSPAGRSDGRMDPLALGTLLHRCMELYDFARPVSAEALLARAMGPAADAPPDVVNLLQAMLTTFRAQPIAASLAEATEVHRELDFLLSVGRATLRGQIDLLYRDAAGAWRIVDYKSDRLSTEADPTEKLSQYELQLLVYALAVARRTGQPPVEASLYFLRTGQTASLSPTGEALASAERRINVLAERILTARRTGRFKPCGRAQCDFCRY